jgi:hypothetical protein
MFSTCLIVKVHLPVLPLALKTVCIRPLGDTGCPIVWIKWRGIFYPPNTGIYREDWVEGTFYPPFCGIYKVKWRAYSTLWDKKGRKDRQH